MKDEVKKVVIYGGNGFVGSHCASKLADQGVEVVCLSRSGHKPLHLNGDDWSQHVRWCKGDASTPDLELLANVDVMICAVGSPPLPTFSSEAYEKQLFMNGITCRNAIDGAAQAGIKRVVLIGARIPFFLKTNFFAYYKGKTMAFDAAKAFAAQSAEHSAVVLQPGMVTGKRFLANGKHIRLDLLTAPFSPLMPWQFVSAERMADRVANATLNASDYVDDFTVLGNAQI